MKESHINTDYAFYRVECKHINLNQFCSKCGVIMLDPSENFIKPMRYDYSLELNTITIFKNMFKNAGEININAKQESYLKERSYLIIIVKKLSNKLKFRSQTFFLAIYYLDLIFHSNKIELIHKMELYAICCLLLAAKFNENNRNVPNLPHVQYLTSSIDMSNLYFSIDEFRKTEVICLKILDYKLNYFTSYHFIIFFFTHVIVTESELKQDVKVKILEKMHSFARYLLDFIIDEGEEILLHHSCHIACAIITLAREIILTKFKINPNKQNMLKFVYGVDMVDFERTLIVVKKLYSKCRQSSKRIRKTESKTMSASPQKFYTGKILNNPSISTRETEILSNRNSIHNYCKISGHHLLTNAFTNVPVRILNKTKGSMFKNIDMVLEDSKTRPLSLEDELKIKNLNNDMLSNVGDFRFKILVNGFIEDENSDIRKLNHELLENRNFLTIQNNLEDINLESKENKLHRHKNINWKDQNIEIKSKPIINLNSENKGLKSNRKLYLSETKGIISTLENDLKLPQGRSRIRDGDLKKVIKDKRDFLYKTKKIFENVVLNKNNNENGSNIFANSSQRFKEKRRNLNINDNSNKYNEKSKENNPAIIIKNNININAYVSKNHFPLNSNNKPKMINNNILRNDLVVNYNTSMYKNNVLGSYTNKNSQNYKLTHNLEKENIRKKIDSQISSKSKLTTTLMSNFSKCQNFSIRKFDNKFYHHYQQYDKLIKNKETSSNINYNEQNNNPTSSRVSNNFMNYDKYYKISTSGVNRFGHSYDYIN